jgi:hypothetical protein
MRSFSDLAQFVNKKPDKAKGSKDRSSEDAKKDKGNDSAS